LVVVAEEGVETGGTEQLRHTWVVDIREKSNPVTVSTFPVPDEQDYRAMAGEFGPHNLHENRPGPAFRSDRLVFGTYFNGGVRVHDISDPLQPKEVAYFVPDPPKGSPEAPLRALIFDSWFDSYRGVVVLSRIVEGALKVGTRIRLWSNGQAFDVEGLGAEASGQVELHPLVTDRDEGPWVRPPEQLDKEQPHSARPDHRAVGTGLDPSHLRELYTRRQGLDENRLII
jgi:hypothetical protein